MTRPCSQCRRDLPLSEFYPSDQAGGPCKACRRAGAKRRKDRDPAKVAFQDGRNQARDQGIPWHLTLAEFRELWAGKWHLRGRHRGGLRLVRIDTAGPWSADNVELRTVQGPNPRPQAAAAVTLDDDGRLVRHSPRKVG